MFLRKNKKKVIAVIIFSALAIFFLYQYHNNNIDIERYKMPFMELQVDLSQAGEYKAILNKTFDPELYIALCVVIKGQTKLPPPTIFEGLEATLTIADGLITYHNNVAFHRYYPSFSGAQYFCMCLPPKKFESGKYYCTLTVIKPAEQLKGIPHSIIAYPTYEFLSMISMFLLILVTINAFITAIILTFLFIAWYRNKRSSVSECPKV